MHVGYLFQSKTKLKKLRLLYFHQLDKVPLTLPNERTFTKKKKSLRWARNSRLISRLLAGLQVCCVLISYAINKCNLSASMRVNLSATHFFVDFRWSYYLIRSFKIIGKVSVYDIRVKLRITDRIQFVIYNALRPSVLRLEKYMESIEKTCHARFAW